MADETDYSKEEMLRMDALSLAIDYAGAVAENNHVTDSMLMRIAGDFEEFIGGDRKRQLNEAFAKVTGPPEDEAKE